MTTPATPRSTASMQVSTLGIMPPETVPSAIQARAWASVRLETNRFSPSSTPRTSVSMSSLRALSAPATAPAAVSAGVREALGHLRAADPALLGSVLFWAAQIGTLWASFHAFGEAPPLAVIVMAFFVGMLGNLLPLPGGVGGVDGGMIGAFAAFGVEFGLATVAVLTYRGFAFWLPTIPGVIAYFQLRKTVQRWRRDPVLH